MGITDFIGRRGEPIASTLLTRLCRDDDRPYFWPHYGGEKCETFAFLVGGRWRENPLRSEIVSADAQLDRLGKLF
jgi:hypothetical protein